MRKSLLASSIKDDVWGKKIQAGKWGTKNSLVLLSLRGELDRRGINNSRRLGDLVCDTDAHTRVVAVVRVLLDDQLGEVVNVNFSCLVEAKAVDVEVEVDRTLLNAEDVVQGAVGDGTTDETENAGSQDRCNSNADWSNTLGKLDRVCAWDETLCDGLVVVVATWLGPLWSGEGGADEGGDGNCGELHLDGWYVSGGVECEGCRRRDCSRSGWLLDADADADDDEKRGFLSASYR